MTMPKKYAGVTGGWALVLARLGSSAPIFGFSIRAEGRTAPVASAGVYVADVLIREGDGGYTEAEVEANAVLLSDAPRLAAAVVELRKALHKARSALWYQLESKHGPEKASKHFDILEIDAATASTSEWAA